MVKYSGRFVVEDKANNRKYLADLLFGWDVGDTLTGWGLGGTNPTIATNGKIDFFGNAGGGGWSEGQLLLPNTLGDLISIHHMKATRMADDTSMNQYAFYAGLMDSGWNGGALWNYRSGTPTMWGMWVNPSVLGYAANMARILTSGQEYSLDLIKTPSEIIWLIDNALALRTPVGVAGNASLSSSPIQTWRAMLKYVGFFLQYNAGQVTHWQVRDIKVGRLVGVSW